MFLINTFALAILLSLLTTTMAQFQTLKCLFLSKCDLTQLMWLYSSPPTCRLEWHTPLPLTGTPFRVISALLEDSLSGGSAYKMPTATPASSPSSAASQARGQLSSSLPCRATPALCWCSSRCSLPGAAAMTDSRWCLKVPVHLYSLQSYYTQ